METVISGALGDSFKLGANEQSYRLFQWQHRNQQNRERKQKQEALEEQTSDLLDTALTFATANELEAFRTELNTYDVATIEALQANGAKLEHVEERLERFLQQAHVLPDGRRVFKTEDGLRVFDEFGAEQDVLEIDPIDIADELPRWETVEPVLLERDALLRERSELLDYQERLDQARDALDAGDITVDDFDALKEDLKSAMPDAVRSHIPGMEVSTAAELEVTADGLDISIDMIPGVAVPGLGS